MDPPSSCDGAADSPLPCAAQDGTEVFFKIKLTSALKKIMDVYAQRQGGTPDAYQFIFDGNRIVETATPDDVSDVSAWTREGAP